MKSCWFLIFLPVIAACSDLQFSNDKGQDPAGYDLTNPQVFQLDKRLDEISGIVFLDASNTIVAENDEDGKLFSYSFTDKQITNSIKFGGKGDYEDIAFTGSDWYVLRSDGTLFFVQNSFTDSIKTEEFAFPEKANEFEGLLFDSTKQLLYLLCKSCIADADKRQINLYAFDINTKKWRQDANISLSTEPIQEMLKKKKTTFNPSAIAMQPITKDYFILSGTDDMLVITDSFFKVKDSYKLDAGLYKQAEGICFAKNGDMFISNESAKKGPATILYFKYNPVNEQ